MFFDCLSEASYNPPETDVLDSACPFNVSDIFEISFIMLLIAAVNSFML